MPIVKDRWTTSNQNSDIPRAGSSFGVSKVYKTEDIPNAIQNALKEDSQVLIESFLDGTEVSVGVITYKGKVKVLPITEIVSETEKDISIHAPILKYKFTLSIRLRVSTSVS